MNVKALALLASLALAPVAFSQTATTTPTPVPTTKKLNINQRKENQQDRIAQGVKNGTLSPNETARLEHQEAGINKEEAGMRAQDNGRLTKADRKLITKQQNQESRRIYKNKHDIGHK